MTVFVLNDNAQLYYLFCSQWVWYTKIAKLAIQFTTQYTLRLTICDVTSCYAVLWKIMSVQGSVYSQSSCCNILKCEIHAKRKYNYLPGYTNSLTKTNLLMMFTTVIVWSDNCPVPIFSSHTLHQGCTNPRCLGVGCSVYVLRWLIEICTPASAWDDVLLECSMILIQHVWQEVGVNGVCTWWLMGYTWVVQIYLHYSLLQPTNTNSNYSKNNFSCPPGCNSMWKWWWVSWVLST